MKPVFNRVEPRSFAHHHHWYHKALNAQIHSMVKYFLSMDINQIVERYCHLHPAVTQSVLEEMLSYHPKYFRWSGADLMKATNMNGQSQMVIIETNSCPSGQKSFPLLDDNEEQGGYRLLMAETFLPLIKKVPVDSGAVAVLFDKNDMENAGYAAVLADLINEPVYLVSYQAEDVGKVVRYNRKTNYLEVKDKKKWVPLRAVFRYVTQQPWNRLPLFCKTKILNPVLACLAGGRNKLMAAKAYDFLNAELGGSGLFIQTPTTIWDVTKSGIPLWVAKFGYKAVVKVPYSNAGQGVFPITSAKELAAFMEQDYPYDKFIVQTLVGHPNWSSRHDDEVLYQVGTVPDKKHQSYVFDMRMMVYATAEGFRPLAMYSRKSELPLAAKLTGRQDTRKMLMTNLSFKENNDEWGSDVSRLLLMDSREFNRLGLSLDDLLDAYIQAVLATVAIDKLAQQLVSTKKTFKRKLFQSLNDDQTLIDEIMSLI